MIDYMLRNWTLGALDFCFCGIYQFSWTSIRALSLHIFQSLPLEAEFSKILKWFSQKKDTFRTVVRNMTKSICIHIGTGFSPVFSVVSFWLKNPSFFSMITIFPQLLQRRCLSSSPSLTSLRTPLWFQQPYSSWFLGNLYYHLLSLLTFGISTGHTFSISRLLISLFSGITGKTKVHKKWKGKIIGVWIVIVSDMCEYQGLNVQIQLRKMCCYLRVCGEQTKQTISHLPDESSWNKTTNKKKYNTLFLERIALKKEYLYYWLLLLRSTYFLEAPWEAVLGDLRNGLPWW